MHTNGTWATFGGDARIELAVGLLAAAGAVACAGTRLRQPVRAARPRRRVKVILLVAWVLALISFPVGFAVYADRLGHDYPHLGPQAHDPILPVTLLCAAATFFVILATRKGYRYPTRLGGAVVAAMVGPMFFELPFDLIVMARVYPVAFPETAYFRAWFFVPLFLIELTTMSLLLLSPMAALRRSTCWALALMLAVLGIWAVSGFGYPDSAAPTALNDISKILAFVTAVTLFLPDRLRDWRTDGPRPQAAGAVPAEPAAGIATQPA